MAEARKPAITAIAPWFGGKRSLAPRIVEQLGPHKAYWEPFCGSLAVLFAKKPSQQETAIDLHGNLVNLARVLADPDMSLELYGRASRTLCSTDLYRRSLQWLDDNPLDGSTTDLDAAYHWLLVSWMGRNGYAGCVRTTFQPSVRYTPGGGSSSMRWRNAVESIPPWHERLRSVQILSDDAFEILWKIADVLGVVIYVDPPYVRSTRSNGGGSVYLHDFVEEVPIRVAAADGRGEKPGKRNDHVRLYYRLRRFTHARVIVSYYDHPDLRWLYSGWTVVEETRQKNLHVQNRRGEGRCEAPEVLLINGPSLVAEKEERLFA